MEERKLNVIFNKSGSGSTNTKVSIPITDVRKMSITPEDRDIHYYYDEQNEIMILSKKDLSDYEIKLVKKNKIKNNYTILYSPEKLIQYCIAQNYTKGIVY